MSKHQTIYQRLKEACKGVPGVEFKESYPCDWVEVTGDPVEDESIDTAKPLVEALTAIAGVLKEHLDQCDDVQVVFNHLPGDETWNIRIGDGR